MVTRTVRFKNDGKEAFISDDGIWLCCKHLRFFGADSTAEKIRVSIADVPSDKAVPIILKCDGAKWQWSRTGKTFRGFDRSADIFFNSVLDNHSDPKQYFITSKTIS